MVDKIEINRFFYWLFFCLLADSSFMRNDFCNNHTLLLNLQKTILLLWMIIFHQELKT
jgi:hypothetical protein